MWILYVGVFLNWLLYVRVFETVYYGCELEGCQNDWWSIRMLFLRWI